MKSHFHQSQIQSYHSSKPSKKRLGSHQLQTLETSFNANQKLKAELKLELASQLGLPPRQVAIWYQNRRARQKVEAKESEYKNIQQELGDVLAAKIRLEKEVRILKYEINKAQWMLLNASTLPMTTLLSRSASDDNHANSYSAGHMTYNWLHTSNFSGEELYNCLTVPVSMLDSSHGPLAESERPNHDTISNCRM